jgi:hypothetical protein
MPAIEPGGSHENSRGLCPLSLYTFTPIKMPTVESSPTDAGAMEARRFRKLDVVDNSSMYVIALRREQEV